MNRPTDLSGESTLPVLGNKTPFSDLSAADSLFDDAAKLPYTQLTAALRVRRLEEFAVAVTKRLSELDRPSASRSEFDPTDFGRRLLAAEQEVLGGADDVKIEYLRQYLISCVQESHLDATWKDLFLRYLRLCTGCHLTVLELFFETQGSLSAVDRFELPQPTDQVPLTGRRLQHRLPSAYDSALLFAILADLESFGLIRNWGARRSSEPGWSITDNGVGFFNFVTKRRHK